MEITWWHGCSKGDGERDYSAYCPGEREEAVKAALHGSKSFLPLCLLLQQVLCGWRRRGRGTAWKGAVPAAWWAPGAEKWKPLAVGLSRGCFILARPPGECWQNCSRCPYPFLQPGPSPSFPPWAAEGCCLGASSGASEEERAEHQSDILHMKPQRFLFVTCLSPPALRSLCVQSGQVETVFRACCKNYFQDKWPAHKYTNIDIKIITKKYININVYTGIKRMRLRWHITHHIFEFSTFPGRTLLWFRFLSSTSTLTWQISGEDCISIYFFLQIMSFAIKESHQPVRTELKDKFAVPELQEKTWQA